MNIVHRDIKPENIMLENEENLRIQVIDFGSSSTLEPKERLTDIKGTLMYMAPEVYNMDTGKKADVWSIGIITFMLVTGNYPFSHAKSNQELRELVTKSSIKSLISK